MTPKQKQRKDREVQLIRTHCLTAIRDSNSERISINNEIRELEKHRNQLLPRIIKILEDHFAVVRFSVENQFDGDINRLRARIERLEKMDAENRAQLKALGDDGAAA